MKIIKQLIIMDLPNFIKNHKNNIKFITTISITSLSYIILMVILFKTCIHVFNRWGENLKYYTNGEITYLITLKDHPLNVKTISYNIDEYIKPLTGIGIGLPQKLTFPVKCGLQAASLGKGHATSTNRAKGLGYREEFYDDVQDNHQEKQQTRQPKQQSK